MVDHLVGNSIKERRLNQRKGVLGHQSTSLSQFVPLVTFSLIHSTCADSSQLEKKINELRTTIGPQTEHSSQYYTDACLGRYLEARNWNLNKSKKMLEETIKWRSTYKPEEIQWDEVAHEGEIGKLYRLQHLVYLLENAILNLPEDQEQMACTSVPIKSTQETIHILQNHYPERLDVAFLYNPPWSFEAFWNIVKYFLDYMCGLFLIICILDLFVHLICCVIPGFMEDQLESEQMQLGHFIERYVAVMS
ncbi:hypothetical protein UlMin_027041 [Ulmus minor]